MKRIALTLLVLLTACDAAQVAGAAPSNLGKFEPAPCNPELTEIATERAELLECHCECATLFVECLEQEAPACISCEHEAAVCRSTCSEPVL